MGGRVLHLLSQRPSRTGSGVTLQAIVHHADRTGWDQHVAVGTPVDDGTPAVAGLPPDRVHPLVFGTSQLPFALPGMSDVMPYPSSRFRDLATGELAAYRDAWRAHLQALVVELRPDLIHAHHVWLMSAIAREVAPETPLVVHGHATGLRQMALCPHLVDEVVLGCSRADAWLALHDEQARAMAERLGVAPERVDVVGAGYHEDVFGAVAQDDTPAPEGLPPLAGRGRRLLFVGKLASAKGLPWLLEAFGRLAETDPDVELHLAGGWDGDDGERQLLRARGAAHAVVVHGPLDQAHLAALMRRCAVCVLPSLYEGLPLVLVEARASGCRLVATALPGIRTALAPHLGDGLLLVEPPRLADVDVPDEGDLPRFVGELATALGRALAEPARAPDPRALRPFTWGAVHERIEAVWRRVRRPG